MPAPPQATLWLCWTEEVCCQSLADTGSSAANLPPHKSEQVIVSGYLIEDLFVEFHHWMRVIVMVMALIRSRSLVVSGCSNFADVASSNPHLATIAHIFCF